MSTRTTVFATIFLIAFAIAFSVSVFDRLPDQMASHWNTANQVDGDMSRFWGAFLMPIVSVGMLALFLVIPNIDPLKANISKVPKLLQRVHRAHGCIFGLHAHPDHALEFRL